MQGMKNETYIITNKGDGYKVEAMIGSESKTEEFDDIVSAAEWIERLKEKSNEFCKQR